MDASDIKNDFIKDVPKTRAINFAHPKLIEVYPLIKERFCLDHVPFRLEISCTYRSPKEQRMLYEIGRTIKPIGLKYIRTKIDGINKMSKHNCFPSEAIDFFIEVGGKAIFHGIDNLYKIVGELAEQFGLRWGGNFDMNKDTKDSFVDLCHIEVI